MLRGITGTLFTHAFLERRLRLAGHLPDRGALAAWRAETWATCGPATSVRAIVDKAARRLVEILGWPLEMPRMLDESRWVARLGPDGPPIVIVAWGAPLEPVLRDAARAALASGARWAWLFNGRILRLADVGATSPRRHLDVELEEAIDVEPACACLGRLCEALRRVDERGRLSLDALVGDADDEGRRVCAGLRVGAVAALERLCDGLAADRSSPPLAVAFDEAQTAVYRLLFLAFAEARRLVPTWHHVFRRAYSVAALGDEVDAGRHTGLWATFQAMARLAHAGCEAGDLLVPAFNGRLFAPSRAPLLERAGVDDASVAAAVESLCFTIAGGRRERLSYAELGVEEIGAIYESLLEYAPARVPPAARRPRGRRARLVVLERTAGVRRKETGTYYTPLPLTRYLVRQTLAPLVAGRAPADVLALRIVDPAMGSGAFLVAACRYLAQEYEEALVRSGACAASDISDVERAGFRRLIAQRCLYGVDLNPAAVQLARVSLWLTSLAPDRPLGFLDHRLRCGDSLVGARLADVLARRPTFRRRSPDGQAELPLFAHDDWQASQREALPVRLAFENQPDDTALDVRRKESALALLARVSSRWKDVADLWCTRWSGGSAATGAEYDALVRHLVGDASALPPAVADRAIEDSRRAAADARYLHWPLEFPEVFCDAGGRELADGGFDAVLSNPPWEMLRADRHRAAHAQAMRTVAFAREAGVYVARPSGHVNEYQLFVERAFRLVRPGGRLGLVVPHGLASDQGAAPLRQLLLRECDVDSMLGFENRRRIFPIHRSVRFLLLTATRGGTTRDLRCRFGLQDPAALDGLAERPRGEALPLRFTPALLGRLSGEGLAIPDVRTPDDLALAERLHAVHPRLGEARGWGARFGRELNATEDRTQFTVAATGLPVIDGRHVSPYRVDVSAARRRLPRAAARRLLDEDSTFGRARLAYRDVASATNRTTLIAAVVPAGCVTTHTLFCLRTRMSSDDTWLLAAILNSYVANYLVRLRVSSHVSAGIVEAVPAPRPAAATQVARRMISSARLVAAARDPEGAHEAWLQAQVARLYGLDRREFALVLGSFPLVAREVRDRAAAAFSPIWPR